MKEALGMNGNQLTYCTTMWTVGYVIGQIPSNMILTRIAPRYWIPMLEIGWGICTLASYKVKTYQNLYAIRFFVGLFESGFYPAAQYMLGSFYTPSELGKRAVLFHCMSPVGNMFSGILAAAAYTNLDGVNGLDGWKWLFIVDAIISEPNRPPTGPCSRATELTPDPYRSPLAQPYPSPSPASSSSPRSPAKSPGSRPSGSPRPT
jgi:ACS family pantothenate transporter-like MFS transporter